MFWFCSEEQWSVHICKTLLDNKQSVHQNFVCFQCKHNVLWEYSFGHDVKEFSLRCNCTEEKHAKYWLFLQVVKGKKLKRILYIF